MLTFFILLVAAVNVALGYWLGLLFVRPDLAWTLRHRAVFALRELVDQVRDLPGAAWGFLMRLIGRPPIESAP
jgi:hypothetical protein